jgi:hypothetical protein
VDKDEGFRIFYASFLLHMIPIWIEVVKKDGKKLLKAYQFYWGNIEGKVNSPSRPYK